MTFERRMQERHMSAYRLSRNSEVPYMTINDLMNHKTSLTKCNAETVYKIAKALGASVEELLEPYLRPRPSFSLFKSNVCHRLKELGDLDFLADLLEHDRITEYYELGWYPECLYLLAMLDYISRVNRVPPCTEYDGLRGMKLSAAIYPPGVLAADMASPGQNVKKEAWEQAIPEFKRFNIVENEVRELV